MSFFFAGKMHVYSMIHCPKQTRKRLDTPDENIKQETTKKEEEGKFHVYEYF